MDYLNVLAELSGLEETSSFLIIIAFKASINLVVATFLVIIITFIIITHFKYFPPHYLFRDVNLVEHFYLFIKLILILFVIIAFIKIIIINAITNIIKTSFTILIILIIDLFLDPNLLASLTLLLIKEIYYYLVFLLNFIKISLYFTMLASIIIISYPFLLLPFLN